MKYLFLWYLSLCAIAPTNEWRTYDRVIFRDTLITTLDDFNGMKDKNKRVVELYRWEDGGYVKEGSYQVLEFPPIVPGRKWISFERVRTMYEEGESGWVQVTRKSRYRTRILYRLEEREIIDNRG